MNHPHTPNPAPAPESRDAVANLRAWHELQQQMEELHAHLQYVKLMLKLRVGVK